jgi:hypothetical protein
MVVVAKSLKLALGKRLQPNNYQITSIGSQENQPMGPTRPLSWPKMDNYP